MLGAVHVLSVLLRRRDYLAVRSLKSFSNMNSARMPFTTKAAIRNARSLLHIFCTFSQKPPRPHHHPIQQTPNKTTLPQTPHHAQKHPNQTSNQRVASSNLAGCTNFIGLFVFFMESLFLFCTYFARNVVELLRFTITAGSLSTLPGCTPTPRLSIPRRWLRGCGSSRFGALGV